ncbi:hypothetical protein J7I80_05585 [Bacillus sp. ISL-41]|uniref:hypothetical protein n=1 Tax=Bacillus sp. ISL-41 TaxID=2819127 RepID=UPI001BEC005E|nr:hypothetical protein [Bacillus sp. ISL-41]MBT2641686.1 hypothetical protein [Bacillus sp. ISL-41]
MGWEDENYYTSDTGMLGDSPRRKKSSSRKRRVPHYRPIVRKRIPRTDFGEAMGGLAVGMFFVFPVLATLSMVFPVGFFGIVAIIGLFTWLVSDWQMAAIIVGLIIGMVVLGFVSLGILMALLG